MLFWSCIVRRSVCFVGHPKCDCYVASTSLCISGVVPPPTKTSFGSEDRDRSDLPMIGFRKHNVYVLKFQNSVPYIIIITAIKLYRPITI